MPYQPMARTSLSRGACFLVLDQKLQTMNYLIATRSHDIDLNLFVFVKVCPLERLRLNTELGRILS